jgi:hypothetical protein
MEVSDQYDATAALPRGQKLGTHRIGDWVGPRTRMYAVEKRKIFALLGIEPQLSGSSANGPLTD